MKKIIKILGILDAIALVVMGALYFIFDISLALIRPVLLIVLIACILFNKDEWIHS